VLYIASQLGVGGEFQFKFLFERRCGFSGAFGGGAAIVCRILWRVVGVAGRSWGGCWLSVSYWDLLLSPLGENCGNSRYPVTLG
jgi:hypothetical protein